jgi:3-oxoacyl-[acyl-carrier protein] reductase
MKHVALVTGGSRGIGKAIVETLRKAKYHVLAPSRHELDLSDDTSVERFISSHKNAGIDIIINNAGVNTPEWIEEISDTNLRDTFQVNLIAPLLLIRGLAGGMKKKKWGRIVNISSVFGVVARGKQVLYAATKHGLNGVTKALALELAPYNILVNSVCPGFTRTDLMMKRNSAAKIRGFESDIPLARLAEPKEIAKLVRFLVSEDCTYMTGDEIVIDGGFVSR